ncbi:MAG: sigma-70 family RNA polymerase sigma factor [Sedimentisphaerales bacterium]|nr:sigma-70 family RNA polymerase sigma factor [Sedimentisphaerales bacterium]
MRTISSPSLSQLLRQLRFTPPEKRRKQLDAAEELFGIIDKDKEYPFEFVCFRITGFHLKSAIGSEIIKGENLLEDLRIFITRLSGQIARTIPEVSEKVYTYEELAEKFKVSKKTIYRWRKQGLIGEKFIFKKGTRRFGFLESSVEQFIQAHPDLVGKAEKYERLTIEEKKQIIRNAARLSANTNLSRHRIIRKISSRTGRCFETIRYTLRDYEKVNPQKAVFRKTGGAIDPTQSAEIYRLYKQGVKSKELMERFRRNKSSIYRIINTKRAKLLHAKKIDFIFSEEFLEEDANFKILAKPLRDIWPAVQMDLESFTLVDSSLPEYLQTLKDVPILNRDNEIELFRRYNYLKYLADKNRIGMSLTRVSGRKLRQIEDYLSEAEEIKRRIIEANLPLVVSVARKHTSGRISLFDLLGEGNFSLMNAVEKFDYTKGLRFGTFATWTITKDFAQKVSELFEHFDKSRAASLANIQREMHTGETADFAAIESAHKSLTRVIKENLNEREQYIILHRFGLIGSPIRKKTKTLVEIGMELDLSKERVRQIELIALQKLRQSLSAEEFELLTG